MIHPDTEVLFINDEKGYGLFTTSFIPCGTITWSYDPLDREITPEEMECYDRLYRDIMLKYSFRNNRGNYIFCWDNCRYINHSFNANCCLTPYNLEIAIRDIEAGEELTDDYGYLNIIEPFEAAEEGCDRTVVYPDDLLHYADRWDKQLQTVFPKIMQVEQPLQKFLPHETRETLLAINQGRLRLQSIRNCYYDSEAGCQK